MVSNIHRTIVEGQEGSCDNDVPVSYMTDSIHHRIYANCLLDSDRVSILDYNESNILRSHLAYPVNRLPQHRGPVSDVTS